MIVDLDIGFCLADDVQLTRSTCRTAVPAIGKLGNVRC